MGIRERIREVRKDKGLDQEQFGIRLGVSRGVISNVEIEERNVEIKPLFIQHLCEVFDVNREWLETGVGGMYLVTDESYINSLKKKFGNKVDDLLTNLVYAYLNLNDDERDVAKKYIQKLSETSQPHHSRDMETAEMLTDIEKERLKNFNRGLTEDEAVELVRNRYKAAKRGHVSSTTLEKAGNE